MHSWITCCGVSTFLPSEEVDATWYSNSDVVHHVTEYCNVIGLHCTVWWDTACTKCPTPPFLFGRVGLVCVTVDPVWLGLPKIWYAHLSMVSQLLHWSTLTLNSCPYIPRLVPNTYGFSVTSWGRKFIGLWKHVLTVCELWIQPYNVQLGLFLDLLLRLRGSLVPRPPWNMNMHT